MKVMDPAAVIRAVVEAANKGDVSAMLRYFAADAALSLQPALPPPFRPAYQGRQGVEQYLQQLVTNGFHVESGDFVASGSQVTWHSAMSARVLRQLGVAQADIRSQAVIQAGLIRAIAIHYSPEAVEMMEAALVAEA